MKKFIILSTIMGIVFSFLVCLTSTSVSAQTKTKTEKQTKNVNSEGKSEQVALKDVPKVVLDKLYSVYPKSTVTKASKGVEAGVTAYEISLTLDKRNYEIELTPKGEIIETTELIKISELPSPITKALSDSYPGVTIKEIEKVIENNTLKYEILILQKNKTREVVFDPDGKVLK